MPTTTADDEIVRLLQRVRAGDEGAGRVLFERLYRELRAVARRQLARERRGHTQGPTSLVHEAFVRVHAARLAADDREQFLRLAATVMRHVLIDAARSRQRRQRASSAVAAPGARATGLDAALRLDGALQRLASLDPQLARVVELRFLVGLDVEQTARALGRGTATVKRDWRTARAFLQRELERDDD